MSSTPRPSVTAVPTPPPCNPAYAGLFNQLYSASRRFQEYADPANNFRYKAGQWNQIQYNPDLACGTGNVFLANRATAGLYNYTPYQPNTAAMANLYGTGDACSAYGNRNFWRMFSDWFGNPQAGGGHLMRTPENGTVFVVSGSSKYVVPDLGMLSALAPLGPVGYVSQQYLDRRPTVAMMSRVILAPDGTVYFFDAGIKLSFASCGQVADYGGSCGSMVRLEAVVDRRAAHGSADHADLPDHVGEGVLRRRRGQAGGRRRPGADAGGTADSRGHPARDGREPPALRGAGDPGRGAC